MADLTLYRYRDNTFTLPVTATNEDGTAVDLTGATVEFALNEYTLETDGVSIDPDPTDETGIFEITVTAELMAELSKRYYEFEVRVTDTLGTVLTYFVGGLFLKDGVIEDVIPDD